MKKIVIVSVILFLLTGCATTIEPKPEEGNYFYSEDGLGSVALSVELPVEGEVELSSINFYDEEQLVRLSMFVIRNEIDVEMMNAIIATHLKSESFDEYGYEEVSFDSGKYQVSYHYGYIVEEDQMFSNWVFQDELGLVHVISFLSGKELSDVVVSEINNTFKLTLFDSETLEEIRIVQIKEEQKPVGNQQLGYIDVPYYWESVMETESNIVYSDGSDENIVSLSEVNLDGKTLDEYVEQVIITQELMNQNIVLAGNTSFDFSGLEGKRVLLYDPINNLGKAIFVFYKEGETIGIISMIRHPYLLKELEWDVLGSYSMTGLE